MTNVEYLLVCLIEECNEVSQRATKALRFGLDEVQPGQGDDNLTRLATKFTDLAAIAMMLKDNGVDIINSWSKESLESKMSKVAHFMRYSQECGTLD